MAHLHYAWSLPSGQVEDSRKWAISNWFGSWPGIREKDVPSRSLPDYQLHLHRLLGPEKASYFLYPSTLDQLVSPRVQRLLAADLGMGAEEVWRTLHEEPKRLRQIAEAKKGCLLSQRVPWLGCPSVTLRMQRVANWRQQMHDMHCLGKQHQRTAGRLLASKHLTDLSDTYGTEGPNRYLHCTLDKKQVA